MLITLQQAKDHLRITTAAGDVGDADLLQKMAAAEAAILAFINTTEHWRGITATWTDETNTPADVQHTVLLQLASFDRFRGDDAPNEGPAREDTADLSPEIVRILRRWRDPVLA
jgi:hypothetical protein